jgi:uncharacterized protein
MQNIFDGLDKLGFTNLGNVELFKKEDDSLKKNDIKETNNMISLEQCLYDKTYICPVCEITFKDRTLRTGKTRLISTDSDLRSYYSPIDPIFYDVVLCNNCGYTAINSLFNKINSRQIELISSTISPKFKPHFYPLIYDVDVAIERYKLALLNCVIKNAKDSEKAFICLKLGWLYREKNIPAQEKVYHTHTLDGLKRVFENEAPPFCGLSEYTVMYLIGELSRKLDENETALLWFGKLIISSNANNRLKERAREQKALIKKLI